MNNKVKIILAVVLFAAAIGAIGYYLISSRTEVNPALQENTPPGPPPESDDAILYQR